MVALTDASALPTPVRFNSSGDITGTANLIGLTACTCPWFCMHASKRRKQTNLDSSLQTCEVWKTSQVEKNYQGFTSVNAGG
jgi:hypothetical protein